MTPTMNEQLRTALEELGARVDQIGRRL